MLESHRYDHHHERLLSIHTDEREGEGWMISYMDIMTLLVALFVLLLTVSGQAGDWAGAVRGALAASAPAQAPMPSSARISTEAIGAARAMTVSPIAGARPLTSPLGVRLDALLAPPALSRDALAAAQRVAGRSMLAPQVPVLPKIHTDARQAAGAIAATHWVSGSAQAAAIQVAGEWQLKVPRPLPVIDGVEVSRIKGGINLRIQDHLLFGSGDAELTDPGQDVVQGLVSLLGQYEGTVSVEGHTDSVPISTERYPSNWELSSARATAILRYLVAAGIDPERLRSVGYADTRPLASNDTARGRAANRRVELIIHAPEA
ncbi:OmpA family protein [Halomonas sp. HP20-15]|uniref:OmpA family protein n=1 Tax=Halomonas sp. HP20-15 TaxID=3085901 RepID=UPI002981E8A7|nr:OmpA family protein [Halomonas sp. HP20-15]MDW5375409.1 OmpA family protein [Halomonas sp. HP20-15]